MNTAREGRTFVAGSFRLSDRGICRRIEGRLQSSLSDILGAGHIGRVIAPQRRVSGRSAVVVLLVCGCRWRF
jgi:hypothetical protein